MDSLIVLDNYSVVIYFFIVLHECFRQDILCLLGLLTFLLRLFGRLHVSVPDSVCTNEDQTD